MSSPAAVSAPPAITAGWFAPCYFSPRRSTTSTGRFLALIKPILDEQLHWTNEQFGLTNAFFQLSYAVSLLIFGWIVDRFGTKIGYGPVHCGVERRGTRHALVSTIGGFYVARVFLGLGEGGNFPSAIKATALWFPKRERATATAIFNSGTNVGAIGGATARTTHCPGPRLALGLHFRGHCGHCLAVLLGPVLQRAGKNQGHQRRRARAHRQRQGRHQPRRREDLVAQPAGLPPRPGRSSWRRR